jgi:hypothetical protein
MSGTEGAVPALRPFVPERIVRSPPPPFPPPPSPPHAIDSEPIAKASNWTYTSHEGFVVDILIEA